MKAKGIFISTLLVIDTFFVSYAVGFQSRHVLIVNPKLPPVVQNKVEAKPLPAAVPGKHGDTKGIHTGKGTHTSKTHGKGAQKSEVDKSKTTGAAASTSAKPTAKTSAPADSSKSKVSARDATQATAKPSAKPAPKPAVKPAAKPASESKPKSTQDNHPGA